MKLHLAAGGSCVFAAALALVACAFAGPALAADDTTPTTEVIALSELRPPLLAPPPALDAEMPALQAAIDPQTGLLRPPTVAERIELAALARAGDGLMRRSAAASVIFASDGTGTVVVDPELYSLSTVVIGADGELHFACGDAGHAHSHPIAVNAPAREER